MSLLEQDLLPFPLQLDKVALLSELVGSSCFAPFPRMRSAYLSSCRRKGVPPHSVMDLLLLQELIHILLSQLRMKEMQQMGGALFLSSLRSRLIHLGFGTRALCAQAITKVGLGSKARDVATPIL